MGLLSLNGEQARSQLLTAMIQSFNRQFHWAHASCLIGLPAALRRRSVIEIENSCLAK